MDNDFKKNCQRLRNIYWAMVSIAFLLFFLIFLLHKINNLPSINSKYIGYLGWWLFILAALFGVALPILMRNLFRYKVIKHKKVDINSFFQFEKRTLFIALTSAFVANIAYIFLVPKLHLYGSVLIALYAISVTYPERRKILIDMKCFGLDLNKMQRGNDEPKKI
jgi:hypothetical protein